MDKMKKAAFWAAALGMLALAGCSRGRAAQLENELAFPLDGVSEVIISYDEETVTFHEGEGEALVIQEYMTAHQSSCHARAEQTGGRIAISEGGKPLFDGDFSRYIEIYLPASYHGSLTVTTTDGEIDLSGVALQLDTLRIDSTAGAVRLHTVEAQSLALSTTSGALAADRLEAGTVRIDTTSGDFSCGQLDGEVACTTTSGSLEVRSAAGSGSYQASSEGELAVRYTEVTGDLSFYNKNGSIRVTLPAGLEFAFSATAKNGAVTTTFQEALCLDGGTASGTVGSQPTAAIRAETRNGDIEVTQESGA